jgi:hypothetical protein
MAFYHIKTTPTPATLYKWKTVEQCIATISKRNKRRRMINDEMFIRMSNDKINDPILAWDCKNKRQVFIRKEEWYQGGPCIKRIEACVMIRMAPAIYQKHMNTLGIVGRKGVIGKQELSTRHSVVFYSIDDVVDIINHASTSRTNYASVDEFRTLLGQGYLTYKKIGKEFVPVWN